MTGEKSFNRNWCGTVHNVSNKYGIFSPTSRTSFRVESLFWLRPSPRPLCETQCIAQRLFGRKVGTITTIFQRVLMNCVAILLSTEKKTTCDTRSHLTPAQASRWNVQRRSNRFLWRIKRCRIKTFEAIAQLRKPLCPTKKVSQKVHRGQLVFRNSIKKKYIPNSMWNILLKQTWTQTFSLCTVNGSDQPIPESGNFMCTQQCFVYAKIKTTRK